MWHSEYTHHGFESQCCQLADYVTSLGKMWMPYLPLPGKGMDATRLILAQRHTVMVPQQPLGVMELYKKTFPSNYYDWQVFVYLHILAGIAWEICHLSSVVQGRSAQVTYGRNTKRSVTWKLSKTLTGKLTGYKGHGGAPACQRWTKLVHK